MSLQRVPTVVAADSNRIFLDAFVHLVQSEAIVVGTAVNGEELLALVAKTRPDLAVTDIVLPGISGLETIRRIRAMQEPPHVVILSSLCNPSHVKATIDAGARGFVAKSCAADDLRDAIRVVARGGMYRSSIVDFPDEEMPQDGAGIEQLTDREREVLALVASGMTAREIGQRLGITERTVAFHKDRMKERLGVDSTVALVNMLVRSEYQGL
jgi:DNA-binding NarL/FixJ family response regulator